MRKECTLFPMKPDFRSLRIALLAVCIATAAFASIFLFQPAMLSELYEGTPLDNFHLYLSMSLGSVLMVLATGAFFAFMRPVKYAGVILILILAHFLLFLTDVVVLARAQMKVTTLLPEMLYFLLIATLLIRYYPAVEKAREDRQDQPSPPADPLFDEEGKPAETEQPAEEKEEAKS